MPVFDFRKAERWYGIETVSSTFHVVTEEFQFEGQGGYYRPKHVSGHVWSVGSRNRPELISLADVRPDGTLEVQNPFFSVAGHLIAVQLTGVDNDWNLTPVSSYTNNLQKAVETRIAQFGVCHLTVDVVDYYVDDPRVPKTFHYVAKNLNGGVLLDEQVVQPWGVIAPMGASIELANWLQRCFQEMNQINWRIENVTNSPVGNRNFNFLAGHLPLVEHRPYAVLDYIMLAMAQQPFCSQRKGLNYVNAIANGVGFTDTAKAVVLKVNPLLHSDFLVSDAFGKQHTALLATHGAVIETESALMNGGGHNAPQVDHIVPESRNGGSGANCFSNAQVTSMRYNTSKQDATQSLGIKDALWRQQMGNAITTDPFSRHF